MVIMAILMPWIVILDVTLYGDHGNPYAMDCHPLWQSWQSLCHRLLPYMVIMAILMPWIATLDSDHCNPYATDFHPGWWSLQSICYGFSPWRMIMAILTPLIVTLDGNMSWINCHPGWWSWQHLCQGLSLWMVSDHGNICFMDCHSGWRSAWLYLCHGLYVTLDAMNCHPEWWSWQHICFMHPGWWLWQCTIAIDLQPVLITP